MAKPHTRGLCVNCGSHSGKKANRDGRFCSQRCGYIYAINITEGYEVCPKCGNQDEPGIDGELTCCEDSHK